jgi:signal transduction histidine kinase
MTDTQQNLDISEAIRRQIGQELHDDLGQILMGASMLSSTLARQLIGAKPELAESARQLMELLNEAATRTRHLAQGNHAVGLDDGLMPQLRALMERIRVTTDMHTEILGDLDEPPLDQDQKLQVLRIMQEGANNAVRHSGGNRLTLTLSQPGDRLLIRLVDNGIGIGRDRRRPRRHGLGLQNMRIRADRIGARLDILTLDDGGTALTLDLTLGIGLNQSQTRTAMLEQPSQATSPKA